MKYISYKKWLFITLICGLTSCFSNEYELMGEKKVVGSENLHVKIYQKDEFEQFTPIDFELLDNNDSVLIPRAYLTGTDVSNEKIERFYPFLYDSIFYLCYPYPNVVVIQHLNLTKSQLSKDSLFKKLKAYDNKLTGENVKWW